MHKFLFLVLIVQIIFGQVPYLYPGFPKVIDSLQTSALETYCPVIADLDKDGFREIITISRGLTNTPILHVIKSDGSNQTGFPIIFNNFVWSMACGDVDGNGYLDIVLRSANSLIVIDRFGNNLNGFPASYPNGNQASTFVSLYDLDNDSKLEIYTTGYNQNLNNGSIVVFNHDGSIRAGWPITISGQARKQPAIGDLDNDGFAEIIVSSYKPISNDSGKINIYRHNGVTFSNNWPIYFDSNYINYGGSPSLFLNWQYPESTFICISTSKYINGSYINRVEKYNLNGQLLNRNYSYNLDALGTLVMGDFDNDGKVEFVTGDQYGRSLMAYSNDLEPLLGWPQPGNGEHEYGSVIGKISNNLNIISHNNYASFNYGYGWIFAYNINGSNLNWTPLRPFGLIQTISLSDLNSDGSAEIIANGSQLSKSYIHVWTIPGIIYNNENFPWPQYCHDRYRTNQYGFVPPDEPISIKPISNEIPKRFKVNQNYPNPFNNSTSISFDLPRDGFVTLTIFDVLGREIKKMIDNDMKTGIYRVNFDGQNFSSGIYFYSISFSSKPDNLVLTSSKKMIIIK